jgi:hypothetical protein
MARDGLCNFQPGNILIAHLDESKTKHKFDKKGRQYKYLCEFLEYHHGKVLVRGLNDRAVKVIPIYDAVKISDNANSIPPSFRFFFNH